MFTYAELLSKIIVYNWYCGYITAYYAFANNCTITKNDSNNVRRVLKKHGYSCKIYRGIIAEINKTDKP